MNEVARISGKYRGLRQHNESFLLSEIADSAVFYSQRTRWKGRSRRPGGCRNHGAAKYFGTPQVGGPGGRYLLSCCFSREHLTELD